MNHAYHDTLDLSGSDLDRSESKARKQDEAVLAFFKAHPGEKFTPWECWERIGKPLITSVRRAITNLERSGKILKLDEKKREREGSFNYVWVYPVKYVQGRIM